MMTSSCVLTEDQILFVCKKMEKKRKPEDRGNNEDVMTETVLPEFLIFLFSAVFDKSRDEALETLKIQEEYRSLFLNDSIF